jgi:type IV pilus assembly protein PilW
MRQAISPRAPQRAAGQRGVTLIELMVGMLIGMLAILVISQVLLVSEGQKRTTTSGADAQVNGALSLFTIQRDIQAAGYGFTSSPGIIGCPLSARYNGAAPVGFPATLAPVFITPEAARPLGSVGDSIRILSSSKTSYSVPTRVVPPGIAVAGQSVAVAAALGFAQGDMAVVAADGVQPCWVFEVTAGLTATQLPRVDNARWNAAGTPTQAYGDGSVVVNLGTLIDNRYEINIVNGVNTLQVSSFDSTNPGVRITRDVQTGVVGLLAFYGRDTSAPTDGIVDLYDTTTPANNADWLRVMSVRLIVVARSGQYEKEIVTPANPRWEVGATPATTGATTCGASKCVTIDVGADAAGDVEAKHYRYKVFETIVPMRNMMWSS